MNERQLYPITEAGMALGIGRTKTYALIADGELEAVHIGRRHLVTAASIDALVARLRAEVAA